MELFNRYGTPLFDERVPVVGSSRTPGLPLSQKYMRRLASVQANPVLACAAGDSCQFFTPNKRLWTGSLRGEAHPSACGRAANGERLPCSRAHRCADLLTGGEDHRCGHRVVACVQQTWLHPWCMSRSTVDRLRAWSSACGRAAYTPSCSISCTHAVFKQAPVDRQLARRGSNQRRWNWQTAESDSLAQGRTRTPDTRPRCDLANIRLERERKARDLVLVTPRERDSDCPCRRVH